MNRRRLGLVVGTLAFTFLFASCEKDISENIGKGEKAEIFFSLNTTSYNTAADVVRSAGAREAESTTMYINDSLYLQTTLIPDSEGDLRATAPFINGQRICFEAFDISDPVNPVDSKIYTYSESTGKFTPLTTPLGVDPDGSTIYRFVAYSYFGEANTTPSATIDLSKDLVWGKSTTDRTVVDTETSRTVDINMNHLFAQVKVLVKSGINNVTIDDLDDVEIEGQTWTTVNPFDGSFATASAAKQWVDFDTDELPAEEIESGQRLVFPLSPAPTKVKFGTIEISATVPFSDQTVSFNSILNVGTSYTLVVDVKRCVWARSNIYWNGSEMTFVPAGTDTSKEGYQGLYFKHGSLVGTTPSENYWTSSSRAYVAGNSGYSTYSTWESIPWISSGDVSGYNVGNHTGDICQYINSVYRLPKQGEFNVNAWSRQNYFQSFSGTSADGTYDFISNGRGYIKLPMMGICLPTSGVRWNIGGNPAVYMAAFAGKNGYYWTNAMVALGFTDILSAPYYGNDYPDGGMSVRCVRD